MKKDSDLHKLLFRDTEKWEWSVDENGNDVPPEYGYDEKYVKVVKLPYFIMKALGKTALTEDEYNNKK